LSGTSPDVELAAAIERIRAWGEARDWRGYDPYDALNSPLAPFLTLGRPLGRRLLTQAVKLSPLNLRPLLLVQPEWNAKALALVASGYLRLAMHSDEDLARAHSSRWLNWLVDHPAPGSAPAAWGYHFDVQTRFFGYARDTPNTIATTFVVQALVEGYESFGDERWVDAARAASHFLCEEMLVREGARTYFRYLPGERDLVHNANLLACAALARTARATGEESLLEPVGAALATSLAAQREDGSLPYAEAPGQLWVDNFHTGYVLESLAHCASPFPEVEGPLQRGIAYWENELFLADGTPKYFPDRMHPLDAHSYATAIDTWLALIGHHPRARDRATRVATLLVERMLDASGYVHFQQRRFWTSKVPFVRWTTAPTFRALAGLLLVRSGASRGP
jgi:hypothetical protein